MELNKATIVNTLPVIILIAILSAFYFSSIAPGITWHNNGADGGDFITAAATWGVAHPPGYPFYLTIAWLFQLLPIGSLAFRTNLLSLVCTIIACIVLYKLQEKLVSNSSKKWIPCFFTSLVFGLSQLVWSQAVITEVYALQELLIISALFFLLIASRPPFSKYFNILLGLVYGLAIQNHLSASLLFPFIFLVGNVSTNSHGGMKIWKFRISKININWKSILLRFFGFILGLSFILTILVRAQSASPVNWGMPTNLKQLYWLITGSLYSSSLFDISKDFFLMRISIWGEILLKQIGLIGVVFSIIGLMGYRKKSNATHYVITWLFIVFILFSFFYNSIDSYIYLVFSVISLSIWLGWGIDSIISVLPQKDFWVFLITGIFLCYQLGMGIKTFSTVDASHDMEAEKFWEKVNNEVPQNALVFTDADKDSFTLWYYHFALSQRPDLSVIVMNLLPYDWYQQLLTNTYPDLVVPRVNTENWKTAFKNENITRTICSSIVIEESYIYCEN